MKPTTLVALILILLVPVVAVGIYYNSKRPKTVETTTTTDDVVSAKKVVLKTAKGDITINLFPEDAPKTVQNFVTLGKRGYYTNTYFHRIIKDFVVQGGDPTETGRGGESIYGSAFEDEINSHKVVKGSVAMANAGPNTNGSQFFIVTTAEQPNLDGKHTVFGQIDPASQPVVDALAAIAVGDPQSGTPVVDTAGATITGFEIIE